MPGKRKKQKIIESGGERNDQTAMGASPVLRKAIYEIVDNQLRDRNPPQTKQTLDRLVAEGYSAEEARRLIANVVAIEVFDILKNNQVFDEARYVSALRCLPRLPWEE
jgi:hypothetical protein